MSKRLKIPAKFSSESAERAFWEKNDSTRYLDWNKAQVATVATLKPSTKTISMRLPPVDVPRFRGQFSVFSDRIFVLPPRSYTAGQSHAAGGRSPALRNTEVAR